MAKRQSRQLSTAQDDLHSQSSKPKYQPPNHKRALNAFTIAEQQFPSKTGLPRHRLGSEEVEDERYTKRRRTGAEGGVRDDITAGDDRDHFTDSDGNEYRIGEVNSDDDSEIDSDEALGSDEEAFAGYSFRGSSKNRKGKQKRRNKESFGGYEDENAEFSDESLGSDAVDLATAWDMNTAALEEKVDSQKKKKQTKRDDKSESSHDFADFGEEDDQEDGVSETETDADADAETEESSSDEDEDEESDSDILSVSEDEGTSHKRGLAKLQKFVSNLNPDPSTSQRSQQHSNAAVQGSTPTEFGLLPSRKLTTADLMSTISDSRLKKSLKYVDAEPSTNQSGTAGIPGKLNAPLAKRQQDRIDRAAAFEKSKETLDRWIDTVKHNRRAEHLSFPLPEPGVNEQVRIQDTKARTDLEAAIQNILVESGLADSNDTSGGEKKIQEAEGLEAKKIPLEEIQARRAELRKARDLMFREEARAKRIKKIKSRSYRRVHRKERERMDQEEREALAAAGVEMEDEDREAAERQRALARMGAKHRESKFAKSLKQTGRAGWDDEARQNVLDTARRQEELRSRIEGKRVRGEGEDEEYLSTSSSGDSEFDDDVSEADGFAGNPDAQVKKLNEKLDKLSAGNTSTGEVVAGPYAKLMGMKFMQNADASRKIANDAEIKKLRHAIGQAGDESEEYDSESEAGRFKFGKTEQSKKATAKTSAEQRREFEAPEDDEGREVVDSENELQIKVDSTPAGDLASKAQKRKGFADKKKNNNRSSISARADGFTRDEKEEEEFNPWLAEPGQEKRRNRKTVDVGAEKVLISSEKELFEASMETAEKSAPASAPKKTPARQQQQQIHEQDDETSDSDSDSGTKVPVLLKNADLVRRAFAGDEVLDNFEKEKHDIVKEEDDQIVDTTLPGWGSWIGDGLSKKEKKAQKKTMQVVEGIKAQNRKDAKLDRVIINEKRQRKNVKYMASQLPHPFESRQQYERSLRLPVGPEWTTKATFQKATKPRIMVKQGIIKPMQKPLV